MSFGKQFDPLDHERKAWGLRGPRVREHRGIPPSSKDPGNADTRDVYIATMFVGGEVGDTIAKYIGLRELLDRVMKAAVDIGDPLPNPLHHWCIIVGDYLYELVPLALSIENLAVMISYKRQPASSKSWTKTRIGVTADSDSQIHEAAQKTISEMPKWYHLQDNNCQHFVLNLADKILRDPRNKYVVLKGEFISAGGTEAQRSEPAKDEQDFKEEEDFEEEDVVPIVNRDAEGAFIENEEDRRKAMLGSIAEFMVANTPSIQESEAVHQ